MELELVTIGNELLLGFTLDTNAAELAQALAGVGGRVVRTTTVGDQPAAIEGAVREGLGRTGFVITTGGLGPTRDDVTKKVIARIFGAALELDEDYLRELEERFRRLGRSPMPATNRSQAEIPQGATVLANRWGTAPGLWLEGELGQVIMLPGVPREMRGIVETRVLPALAKNRTEEPRKVVRSIVLRTTGIAESAVADNLDGVDDRIAPVTLAYLPSVEGVDLRLTVWNTEEHEADNALEAAAEIIRPLLGAHWYGDGDIDLAAVLLGHLDRAGLSLAVAESCTGGMIGQRITSVPGSSNVFLGGIVPYANEAKSSALHVSQDVLEEHGAVSEPLARVMAREVAEVLGADSSIAVTGVAGPGGGLPEKPVGTVWIAATLADREKVIKRVFPGSRDDVRKRSAQAGLDLLRRMITTAK